MLIRLLGLVFALLLPLVSAAQAKGAFGSIHVGQWIGGAYTNDATGAFSHCAASAPYQSGIALIVGMGANRQWTIAFMYPAWLLTPGEVIPIGLTFDGREQFNVFGSVADTTFVVVPMPQNSSLLTQFRKANLMTTFAKGNLYHFALTSTSQLMLTLANCVDRINHGGLRAAGDFSVVPAAPQAAAKPVPIEVQSSLKPDHSQDHQLEATEVATNFILKAALQNPKNPQPLRTYSRAGKQRRRLEIRGSIRLRAHYRARRHRERDRCGERNFRQGRQSLQGEVRIWQDCGACR